MSALLSGKPVKYLTYLGILLLGVILGYFLFPSDDAEGNTEPPTEDLPEQVVYSCAMHPDVRLPHAGKCPYCAMDLVAASQGAALSSGQFEMQEDALALANIQTAVIRPSQSPDRVIRLSGVILPNEKTTSTQTTLFDGRIDRLDVNFVGETVRKGQEIGLIYSPELYLAQDKLLTSSSYKDTHVKLYEAARNGLGLWKLTDEQIDEILRKGKPLVNFPLLADVSGTVIEVMASEGNYYQQGDPLFKLADLSSVWAVFDAYENQVQHLEIGQEILITLPAFPDWELRAKINFIEPVFDQERRTVSVRAEIRNPNGKLKPGMFAEAQVQVEGDQEGIWIPRSSVLWTGKRSLVYVKPFRDQAIFESREVRLGSPLEGYYEVLEGLQPNEEIVVYGTFKVDAAAQLQKKPSMMNPSKMESMEIQDSGMKPMSHAMPPGGNPAAVLRLYLSLKDAFVGSDARLVHTRVEALKKEWEQYESSMAQAGTDPSLEKIGSLLTAMSQTHDLSEQRRLFKPLSGAMIDLIKSSDGFETALYIQFCPMADGNQGAFWLSAEEQIANPYFGDQMLRCGEVVEVLKEGEN